MTMPYQWGYDLSRFQTAVCVNNNDENLSVFVPSSYQVCMKKDFLFFTKRHTWKTLLLAQGSRIFPPPPRRSCDLLRCLPDLWFNRVAAHVSWDRRVVPSSASRRRGCSWMKCDSICVNTKPIATPSIRLGLWPVYLHIIYSSKVFVDSFISLKSDWGWNMNVFLAIKGHRPSKRPCVL